MQYNDISSQHWVGERFQAYTEWEGDKRWQEVRIEEIHKKYAKVTNEIYSWCIPWSDFLDIKRVIICGG